MTAFNLGARVSFDGQHRRQLRIVVKYHRKTVMALGDNGRQRRVSPWLLSPVKDVNGSAGQTRKQGNKKRLR